MAFNSLAVCDGEQMEAGMVSARGLLKGRE
jgi:hypothetical protein